MVELPTVNCPEKVGGHIEPALDLFNQFLITIPKKHINK